MVGSAVLLKLTTLDEMNPVPVTVRFCDAEPATTVAGVTEMRLGVGFWVGEDCCVLVLEPPPQPERLRITANDAKARQGRR